MGIYTAEQWNKDGSFAALPGQEIEESIYNDLFNVLPPIDLPIAAAQDAQERYNIPVSPGNPQSNG